MTKKSLSKWFTRNKVLLRDVLVWVIIGAIGGTATAFIPKVSEQNRLGVLANAGIVTLNILVFYIAFAGVVRNIFKPSQGVIGAAKFIFRKDMTTTLFGVILFGIVFASLPTIASRGVFPLPPTGPIVIGLLGAWLVIIFAMKRLYAIQFYEEVLTPKERKKYEADLVAKPEKVEKKGMFLVDLNNMIRSRSNSITKVEKPRTHKVIFPSVQSLFVLLSPAVVLSWSLYVFPLESYTIFSAITAPAVIALAGAAWGIWHVKGGFTRVVTKRVGRVMESTKS
jgi:hypothetical protein